MTGLLSKLNFLRSPTPLHDARPLRAYAATRSENAAVARKRAETTAELQRFVHDSAQQRAYEAMERALGLSLEP